MVQRLTYRRQNSWNTKSNKFRIIKTPGGKLRYLHVKSKKSPVKCGDCKNPLAGIPALAPREYAQVPKRVKTVSRAYGGTLCGKCVRDRVVRAFLVEEQKIVKSLMSKGKAVGNTKA